MEVVQWLAIREELSVAELEERTVLQDSQSFTACVQVYFICCCRSASVYSWLFLSLSILALHSLLLTICLCFCVYDFFTAHKVLSPASFVNLDALHPWMRQDLFDGRPFAWLERHKFLEQVFEVVRKDLLASICFLVKLPEVRVFARSK